MNLIERFAVIVAPWLLMLTSAIAAMPEPDAWNIGPVLAAGISQRLVEEETDPAAAHETPCQPSRRYDCEPSNGIVGLVTFSGLWRS